MSKLSNSLKQLIAAPWALPDVTPAPKNIRSLYEALKKEAEGKGVGFGAWLTLSSAATFTLNSPDSLATLYTVATKETQDHAKKVHVAELIREVGLKCIGFNGVPRTINSLGAFHALLPTDITSSLSTTPTRHLTPQNIDSVNARGQSLWKSVYNPLDVKLASKLAVSHPDLPVFIIASEYGALFSDPPAKAHHGATVGRVLTSIVAVACLRAQTGVGPQVTSHVFGLRKAYVDGTAKAEEERGEGVEGGEWLAGNEGSEWLLGAVDRIVEVLGEGRGTTFAPGFRAKL